MGEVFPPFWISPVSAVTPIDKGQGLGACCSLRISLHRMRQSVCLAALLCSRGEQRGSGGYLSSDAEAQNAGLHQRPQ